MLKTPIDAIIRETGKWAKCSEPYEVKLLMYKLVNIYLRMKRAGINEVDRRVWARRMTCAVRSGIKNRIKNKINE